MTATEIMDCPPVEDAARPFASLGAIDRVGDAFCRSARDIQCISEVQRYRSFRMRCLRTTLAIADACSVPGRAAVSLRLKRLDSIRLKIQRPDTSFSLGRLDDVIGVRIVCESLSAVRDLSDRLQASPHFYRRKDYIAEPAATGYRGINHIMRFRQPVSRTASLAVRFEIQTRTYLQHLWAVWSESRGEAAKLGTGDMEERDHLRAHSGKISRWEADNPSARQVELPEYAGGHSIAICWRPRHGRVMTYFFADEAQEAVDWLHHLETGHPARRGNALLLVGGIRAAGAERLLRLTHPLFAGGPVLEPEYWIPSPPS